MPPDPALGKADVSKPSTVGPRPAALMRKLWPLLLLAALLALAVSMGWHHYLSLQSVAMHREALRAFIDTHFWVALFAYMLLYVVVIAVSIPGGAALTFAGGLLFGPWIGAPATVVAATIGATLLFLIVRSSLGEALAAQAGPWLSKLKDGFRENALSYLLFLRLVPAIPFAIVNLAPALLGVPLGTYVLGTAIGIIPGTIAYTYLGAGLDSVIDAQKRAYDDCLAKSLAGAASDCRFTIDPGSLVTPELVIAFSLLAVVALIPVVVRRLRKG